MQLIRTRQAHRQIEVDPLPFPGRRRAATSHGGTEASAGHDVIEALQTVSRNITDLARELKCLGYFDDPDSDRPRAA